MLAKFSICDLQETSFFNKQIYVRVRHFRTFQELLMMLMMIVDVMVVCLV